MQAQLLRFLESGEIQTVGREAGPAHVDVRIITATNRDLTERVASGHFREDLLYRIKVIHLHVPPLRDRREDVRPLVLRAVARAGRPVRLADQALEALERYRWPGNVRELQNVVEQVSWMCKGEEVTLADLPEEIRLPPNALLPKRERRRQLANELYEALVGGHYGFWDHIRALFLSRDMTRHDLRQLLRRGLMTTRGNYRALLPLFGVPESDYKRFMNFLAAHDCVVDFREFRNAPAEPDTLLAPLGPPPRPVKVASRPRSPSRPPEWPVRRSCRTCSAIRGRRTRCATRAAGASWPATVELAVDSESRRRGLLGRDTFDEGSAIIIAPCSAIHTFFMRFAIDVVFVARDGRVLKTYAAIPARRMAFRAGAFAAVELPAGTLARSEARPGDLLQLEARHT